MMTSHLKLPLCCLFLLGVLPIQAITTLQDVEEQFAQAEELEGDDRLKLLTSCLYKINARIRPFPDTEASAKLNAKVQDRLFSIPGHAEYVGRQLREPWEASLKGDLDKYGTYMGIREARFKLLSFMPSPETVKMVADFIDYSNHPHPRVEHGFPAYDAVKVLLQLLEDPPVERVAPFKPWIQWREDVEAGKITYRLKGVGGEYNFKGPVGSSHSPNRQGSRPVPGRKEMTEDGGGDAGASKDGPPVTMIVIAAIFLVGAVAWFMVSRRTVSG